MIDAGQNVLRVFYQVAADVAGVQLSEYELAFTDRCLSATTAVVEGEDEGRTAIADQIEAEDAAAMAAAQRTGCTCALQ